MKKALIDSSSSILLFKAGLFEDLVYFYEIAVSQSVFDELTKEGYAGAAEFAAYGKEQKIKIYPGFSGREEDRGDNSLSRLHSGERDTILLYHNAAVPADFIIIDDGKGAAYCRDTGIPYINALLVPKLFFFSDLLSWERFYETTEKIISLGRYSKFVLDYARNCMEEDLELFTITPGL
ncbi:MAG: hypothetical protein GY754_30295 [bacterium]|nr:hypothetical protein [bacterium]